LPNSHFFSADYHSPGRVKYRLPDALLLRGEGISVAIATPPPASVQFLIGEPS
jgi:hypothetical protein